MAIFSDRFAEDQITLMLQNARQIHNVIKGTSAKFDLYSDTPPECEQPEPKEVLSCMWSQVSKIPEAGSQPYVIDTLHSLIKVG